MLNRDIFVQASVFLKISMRGSRQDTYYEGKFKREHESKLALINLFILTIK